MSEAASFPVPQEWDVEPDAAAIASARRLVVDVARFWRVPLSDDALRDVELCTSELLANAMEHTKARCKVMVRWTGTHLRVEVADTSLRLPNPDSAQDTVTGGGGLILVAGLSHSWGWHPAGVGKVVWFEIAADQLVTGDARLSVLVHAAQARPDPVARTV
ncbi:ATP-binding protein [Kitasatospora sp. NPDC005748]|uniref:ATP-binding protein n=1 Tax=Kitasatospora sp. NPDC005748 TaxID=3157063 RepID=UPI0033BFCEC8